MAKFGRAVAMELIADWLEKLGLSEYAQRFAENAIDLSTIRDLTEQDLKDIGVRLGHRRKILRAIAELNGITSSSSETATASKLPDEAERRHLTVLICDLVGSTALSSRLDPEDMRTVIDAYHAACARIMPTYEGFLAEFRGDGILAYFGYPRAHEDDAERTVRAALDIIAAVAALKTRAGHPLAVRIGIATGLVLVGNLTGHRALREHAVVGDAPNVAARLLAVAEPGTIVIAASTRRLIGDLFRLRDLGSHEVRGIAEPMASWVVEGLSASESRFESVRVSRLTDVIGRGKEIDFLLHRQRQAWKGEGQIVLISGEPGIGKSRIAAAVSERIAGEPHLRLRYQCSPYHTNSALRPFIAQLERAAGFKADDTVEERLSKIETLLALSASRVRNVAPLFASLLSIPSGDRYPPLGLSPAQQRRRTLAALLDQFERLAHQQPILLVFEDVHWADATSLELLDLTVVRMRQLQVLALVTSRPEFQPPWVGRPNATTLALGRLDRDDVETMVGRLTGGYPLPAEVMKQIVGKTDGNPLFVEELTKTVLEADILIKDAGSYRLAGPLPALAIPTTLQDSLMARLDRLAPVREISQIGAVIGREFSYTLIRAVVGRDERALKQALDQLEEAELVFRRGDPPEATYTFKHALVRDAAYESLLKSRRQQLHSQLAKVLAEKFPEIVASQPEIVAHHFTEAGLVEPAIDYWLKAGQQAMRRSANAEALNHVARGLQLLPEIENPHQRNKFELLLQISQGNSLRATKGWSVDDVKHAYTRALQLCKNSGFDEHTLSAVFGLWTWNFVHGALREALSLAEHLVRTAGNMDDPVCKVLAYEALGFTLFARGNFPASHAALERSLSFCEDGKAAVYLDLSAQDPRVHVRLYDGLALCLLGYPDLALRICAQARHYAESSQHPFSEAMARTISLRVYQFRGEATMVAEQANTAIAQCEEHDFVHYLAQALILRGWAVAQQGEFEKGLIEIQQGVDKARAAGAFLFESYTLGLQADACITNKRYEQAFEFLKQAELRLDQENSERFYAAEIYRLFGEACVRSDRPLDLAEHYFRKGLTIASEQTAKLFELRLSLSIYDFYQQKQGEKNYCPQLDKIYRSFSEGFDATDLVKAKARLTNA